MSRRPKHITAENKNNLELTTSDAVDFSPFKQDIDDLINEFCEHESTSLADFKRIWISRKFSCIYEATPKSGLTMYTMYMQTLYAQSLGHMVSSESLSRRLGGLYCLYCLHETQPFKPPYRIYISLRELKNLKYLATTAKEEGIAVVSHLVKTMLEKNMFYFGSVDINEASVVETVNQITQLQNAKVQLAYKMLFSNTRMEHLLLMDLDSEIGMDVVKKSLSGYAEAKKEAIKEASEVVGVHGLEHIADDKSEAEVTLQQITDSWEAERSRFVQQTGFKKRGVDKQHSEQPVLLIDNGSQKQRNEGEEEEEEGDTDDFDKMLEDLLPDPN